LNRCEAAEDAAALRATSTEGRRSPLARAVCESEPTRRRDLRATELDCERGEARAIRNGAGEHAADAVSSGQELANQEEAEKATAKLKRGAQKHHWTEEHGPLEGTRMNDLSKGLLKNEGESG
jgi:hypothetical protein